MERSRLGSMQRETTAEMATNISREVRELRAPWLTAGAILWPNPRSRRHCWRTCW